MEEAWQAGNKLGVAEFYADDGYLLSGNRIAAQGRQAINNYWTDFRGNPVSWDLTTIAIGKNFDTITDHERWKEISASIPLWEDFDIELPSDVIYHFGQSNLSFTRANEEETTSKVDFLLVWKKVNGAYKIYLDSYN
jgi:ketosteroid isomerase-like protein